MKKEINLIVSLLIFIFVFSAFAYAESSSGNAPGNPTAANNSANNSAVQPVAGCEDKTTVRERVKCRLQIGAGVNYNNTNQTHESCRNLATTSKENCRRLYQEIKECYNKEGREKDRCFKLKTGFATSAVSGQGINKEAARKYLVTLLYELEERVEEKQAAGIITADQAADIITKIVEIKEKILQNVPGSEIRPLLQQLKQTWRQVFNITPTAYSCQSDNDCEIRVWSDCCGSTLWAINKCYHVAEPIQTVPTCPSNIPCSGIPAPSITNCECINSVCTGTRN